METSRGEPQPRMDGAEQVAELSAVPGEAGASVALRPGVALCVDLDGTLV